MLLGGVGDALFQDVNVSLELSSVGGGCICTAKIVLTLGAGSSENLKQFLSCYKVSTPYAPIQSSVKSSVAASMICPRCLAVRLAENKAYKTVALAWWGV